MLVSSVNIWLEQIRKSTESYDCNTLEQRRLAPIDLEVTLRNPKVFQKANSTGNLKKSISCETRLSLNGVESVDGNILSRSQCLEDISALGEPPKKPALRVKSKSLDSLLETEEPNCVELRSKKRHSLCAFSLHKEHRMAFMDKPHKRRSNLETINEDPLYARIWDCSTLNQADMGRTSCFFEETVEELKIDPLTPVKYKIDIPNDTIFWLMQLVESYSAEDDGEMESYGGYVPNRFPVTAADHENDYKKVRQTMAICSPAEFRRFEKCFKVSVDGKTYKVNKNETLQLKNGVLSINDERGNLKSTLIGDFVNYHSERSKNSKEIVLVDARSTVKIYLDKDAPILERHNFLQKFFRKRMSKEDLERKGIYKNEPIFGNTLRILSEKYSRTVPDFVTKTIEYIELPQNISSPGIYRASGNVATVQKIRLKVDNNKLGVLEEHKFDTDVLAGALKMFFRELEESLISNEDYEKLVKIYGSQISTESKYKEVGRVICSLHVSHKETLRVLMEHLLRVTESEKENHMSVQNMSICWGPSIISFADPNIKQENVVQAAQMKNSIVELLLRTYNSTFACNLPPSSESNMSIQSELLTPTSSRRELTRSFSDNSSHFGGSSNSLFGGCSPLISKITNLIECRQDMTMAYEGVITNARIEKIYKKSQQKQSKTLRGLVEKASTPDLGSTLRKLVDGMKFGLDGEDLFASFTSLHPAKQITLQQLLTHLNKVITNSNDPSMKDKVRKFWSSVFFTKETYFDKMLEIYERIEEPESPKKPREVSIYDNVTDSCSTCCNNRPQTLPYSKSDDAQQ